jgi:hypothetical protein
MAAQGYRRKSPLGGGQEGRSARRGSRTVVGRPGVAPKAIAIEVKRSTDACYMRQGLEEALFYRYELVPTEGVNLRQLRCSDLR